MLALVELSEITSRGGGEVEENDETEDSSGMLSSEQGCKVLSRLDSTESTEGTYICAANSTFMWLAVLIRYKYDCAKRYLLFCPHKRK